MRICGLRILPPFAIARLGSSDQPMDNYTLEDDPDHPLGFRQIKALPSFQLDAKTGEIIEAKTPSEITFTDGEKIRPVAPFLEVFAVIEDQGKQTLQALDADLLKNFGSKEAAWQVKVANRKVFRRTECPEDVVQGTTGWFTDHEPHALEGHSKNFVSPEKFIRFGTVRFIKPNEKFPQYRLRFTPAKGLIYGPKPRPEDPVDPVPVIPPDRAIYDPTKLWFQLGSSPDKPVKNETVPPSLYAIFPPAPSWLNDNIAISRGYLDDTCDGFVEFRLVLLNGEEHTATARICSAPPAVVPDSLFVRTLADDLDQVINGPEFWEPYEETRNRALDIVRRAFETVRFMNVAVMNGNDVGGRSSLSLDSMPEEEAADTERSIRPVMSPGTVDTFTILALHKHVYTALLGGAAPWFVDLLRQPGEVADFTDRGRRKMPALMCGADNNYLALTYRQINAIRRAATEALFQDEAKEKAPASPYIEPLNGSARDLFPPDVAARRSAHVRYEAEGNPVSSRPITSVANCCPGLEVDFRAVWRRIFQGIVLREYDNLVMEVDNATKKRLGIDLCKHRLLRVRSLEDAGQAWEMMTPITGPAPSDPRGEILLTTPLNPNGLAPLEWSNGLAFVLKNFQGKTVECDFTKEPEEFHQPLLEDPKNYVTFTFKVRHFFADDTAVISRELATEGELTQGLCSPWQNDYRECSCYYWASARPDYVDVKAGEDGLSHGDNWFQKKRTGEYVPDDYQDQRLVLYDDLFQDWEHWLRFQIRGKDAERKKAEHEREPQKAGGAGA